VNHLTLFPADEYNETSSASSLVHLLNKLDFPADSLC